MKQPESRQKSVSSLTSAVKRALLPYKGISCSKHPDETYFNNVHQAIVIYLPSNLNSNVASNLTITVPSSFI